MPAPTLTPRPLKRKGYWYFARRVPIDLVPLDKRAYVFQSTGIRITDDPRGISAQKIVNQLELRIQSYWRSLRGGAKPDHGKLQFDRVFAHAGELGYTYIPAAEVAALKPVELLERVQLVDRPATIEDPLAVSTFLGGEKRPAILLSDMRETYEEIVATSLRQKSERQRQRWRTTRDFAVANFIDTIGGDRAITGLTRQHVLTFRNKWQSRIAMDEVEVDTANKSIGYVGTMFRAINDTHMLGLPAIFDKANLRGAKSRRRVPYTPAYVQDTLLADGLFKDLNDEARCLFYLFVETGLRLSEACNLTRKTIVLNHPIPHVQIRPDGREMKTDQSNREIPLVGVSLMAARQCPNGFPRYRDKADSLSALLNKALEVRNLRPDGQTVYSLRHTFKDRLRAVQAPAELMDALMGHKRDEPEYGYGYSLEIKAEWLGKIAFRPPSAV